MGTGFRQELSVREHGIFADHPVRVLLPAKVAPGTEGEFNTLRDPLITVACANLPDYLFEFDSSFIKPDAAGFNADFADVRKRFPQSQLSIFGHADAVGQDAYNTALSGRRAAAFYGMLTRDVDLWDDLYTNAGQKTQPAAGDRWGDKSLQHMLSVVTNPAGVPYYAGPVDDRDRPEYQTALRDWRRDNGVTPGPDSRKKLYRRYMDAVCRNASGQPFRLEKTDFLGQGLGPFGKADYQGCGEFNPQLVLSAEEDAAFQKSQSKGDREERNQRNQPNRRVIALFFRKGTRVDPVAWPCPNIHDPKGSRQCPKRFWADGELRRKPQAEEREFRKTRDTFACRFYHGLTAGSPCESRVTLWNLRLLTRTPLAGLPDEALVGARYVVRVSTAETAPQVRGNTDDGGNLSVPSFHDPADGAVAMTLKVDFNWVDEAFHKPRVRLKDPPAEPKEPETPDVDEAKFLTLTLNAGTLLPLAGGARGPAAQRLQNLHYGPIPPAAGRETPDPFTTARDRFKRNQKLPPEASAAETDQRLRQVYGS